MFLIKILINYRNAVRDALAETGTGPALLAIQQLIATKKLQGEEAAEVIAALPRSARTPTAEYISTFFVSLFEFYNKFEMLNEISYIFRNLLQVPK